MRRIAPMALALLAAPLALAFAQDSKDDAKDIVERTYISRDFFTLNKAIMDAGLTETLKGKGPFTVLAPTDAAFAKIPKEKREDLFKPENKEKLAGILKNHVIAGEVTKADVLKLDGKKAETLGGGSVPVKVQGDSVMIGNARVTNADIKCTNGVIHAIDAVLMPQGN